MTIDELKKHVVGCGQHCCIIAPPPPGCVGMNGMCHCLDDIKYANKEEHARIYRSIQAMRQIIANYEKKE